MTSRDDPPGSQGRDDPPGSQRENPAGGSPEPGAPVGEREAWLSEAEGVAGVGSYLWEPGKTPGWSDGFYRILGYEPGHVPPSAEAFFARVHPDDRERVARAQAEARGGKLPDIEYRILRADTGEERFLRATGMVYRDETDGQLRRMVGALVDITASKLVALRNERALVTMRAAERLARIGNFLVELDPLHSEWSQGMYELTGLEPGDADPRARLEMIHPDDREAHMTWFSQVCQGKRMPPLQARFLRSDGELRHVLTHAAMERFESDGRQRVVGIAIDVTDRVLLEERLRHAAKMEAVGTLAAGVAHDFNNYLMVISGSLEMLAQSPRPDGQAARELRQHATHATGRCMQLTQQLLAFARRRPARREAVELREAVQGIGKLLQPSMGRNIDLVIQTPSAPLSARVDRAHLEQMLANLTLNARDAILAEAGRSGRIEVQLDTIVLDAPARLVPVDVGAGCWARIRVSDNGSGIEADAVGRIFEPYFTTKAVGRGSGLGLAAVYGAVVQNGGHVTVESLPGKGTCFTIWLPALETCVAGAARDVSPRPASPPAKQVLVVDDMPEVRRVAVLSLRAAGFVVAEAESGRQALERVAQEPFDLVLTDVRMPGMDGLELATRLRARHPGVAVVLMTGFSDMVVDPDLPLLHKPVSSEDLVRAVRRQLECVSHARGAETHTE